MMDRKQGSMNQVKKDYETLSDLFDDDINGMFDDEQSPAEGEIAFESMDDLNEPDEDQLPPELKLNDGPEPSLSNAIVMNLNDAALGNDGTHSNGNVASTATGSATNTTTTTPPPLQLEADKPIKGKRRRQTSINKIEHGDRGMPPPRWHSEAADQGHRQTMVVEIAKLLQARKKTQPTAEWLRQLPHKARNLEEKLYRMAPSLEAYLDRTTLKNRLRLLAQIITTRYKESKTRQRPSVATMVSSTTASSSASSASGLLGGFRRSSLRDSLSSLHSLSSLTDFSDAFPDKSIQFPFPGTANILGMEPQPLVRKSSSFGSLGDAISTGDEITTNLPSSCITVNNNTASNISSTATTTSSALERQKAMNERLQQQIMESIRQQEELVRNLQGNSFAEETNVVSLQQQSAGVGFSAHLHNTNLMESRVIPGQGNIRSSGATETPAMYFSAGNRNEMESLPAGTTLKNAFNPTIGGSGALSNSLQPGTFTSAMVMGTKANSANMYLPNVNFMQQGLHAPDQSQQSFLLQQQGLYPPSHSSMSMLRNPGSIMDASQQHMAMASLPTPTNNMSMALPQTTPQSSLQTNFNPNMPPPAMQRPTIPSMMMNNGGSMLHNGAFLWPGQSN